MAMFPLSLFKKPSFEEKLDMQVRQAGVAQLPAGSRPVIDGDDRTRRAASALGVAVADRPGAPAGGAAAVVQSIEALMSASGATQERKDEVAILPEAKKEEKEVKMEGANAVDGMLDVFKETETVDPVLKARGARVEEIQMDEIADLSRELRMVLSRRAA